MSTLEKISLWGDLELKADGDGLGIIEGYASHFGARDHGNDIVMPGAFKKTLAERKASRMPMLFGHMQTTVPVGVWTDLREDSAGLRVKGQLVFETAEAKQLFAVMKAGGEMGISIGFRTVRKEIEEVEGSDGYPIQTRKLLEVDLREISLVPIPMLDDARVLSVKADAGDDYAAALIRALDDASQHAPITAALDRMIAALRA